jgi:hypothetical protein
MSKERSEFQMLIHRRLIASGCLLAICLGLSGCITAKTIDRAQGSPMLTLNLENKPNGEVELGPGLKVVHETTPDGFYYIFVAFSLAADIVTSPVQIWAWATDYHPCK